MNSKFQLTQLAAAACLIGLTAVACKGSRAFEKADANRNGKLETAELESRLAEVVHASGDANRDGNLTIEEWTKVYAKSNKATFSKYDGDGTTGLTLKEATAALEGEGTFKKLTAKIDTNRDGVIEKTEAGVFHDAMEAADGRNDIEKLDSILN